MNDYIEERWRKPVKPMAVTEDPAVVSADLGRETQGIRVRFTPADIERIRTGYVCIRCWEPHPEPFPVACAVCGYAMRENQADDFRKQFQGVERNPRAVLIGNELDKLDDKHERNFYVNKNGILVPKGV